jgi:uncharacterized protein with ATP-grasp and redox domains
MVESLLDTSRAFGSLIGGYPESSFGRAEAFIMLIWADCIPCTLRMALAIARQVIGDEEQVRGFVGEILKFKPLKGEGWRMTSPEVIKDIWLKLQEVSGQADPLQNIKREQNRLALQIYPFSKALVSKGREPLVEAVKLAIGANSIDAMADIDVKPSKEMFKKFSGSAVSLKDIERMRERLRKARKIAYLADNCGEIVFDRLLIETIRETYDVEVTFVTRTLPVLNDATLEDALSVGIGSLAQVMENGIREPLPGTILKKASPELRGLIEGSDLLISKGGGNYDTLTEEENLRGKVSFLIRTKCHPYCAIHKVPLGTFIVHNF